jgi:hypothetical protein
MPRPVFDDGVRMVSFDRAMMRDFLMQRFPAMERGERIEIRALDRHQGGSIVARGFFPSPEDAVEYAMGLNPAWEIYYGINPRLGSDGTKRGVTRILVNWADLDEKKYDDLNAARAMLDGFDLSPTWVIFTGGGYHAYWAIEPLSADTNGPVVERVLRSLYARLGNIDSVQDISRIFRLPGTYNNKYGTPRLVGVVQYDPSARYTQHQVAACLPDIPEEPQRATVGLPTKPGEITLEEVWGLLQYIPPTLPYREYLAIWMAVHSLFPGDEGRDLVDRWSSDARAAAGQYSSPRTQPNKHREFRRSETSGAIGAGTLYHYALQHGWTPPARPYPMIKRRVRESAWRQELDALGEIEYDDLPLMMQRQLDFLGETKDPFSLDWSVLSIAAMWSIGIGHIQFENLYPGLWFLGVARSNSGKNVITDALYKTWNKTKLTRPFGVMSSGSPEGMWTKLEGADKKLLAYYDEFANTLVSFHRDYMATAKGVLCSLYDGRDVYHVLAKKEVAVINPYLSVVATTVPSGIANYMKLEDIQSGYVNRFCVCFADDLDIMVEERATVAQQQALADAITRHLLGLDTVYKARWDTPRGETPALWTQYVKSLGIGSGKVYRVEDAVDEIQPAHGRDLARVKKLATGLESMEASPQIDGDTLLIRERNLRLAILIISRSAANLRGLETIVGVPSDKRLMDRIERTLSKHPEGLPASVLRNRVHAEIKPFRLALDTMIEEGRATETDPPAGKRQTHYKLTATG